MKRLGCEERNEAANMTQQILCALPKHDIIASL